MNSKATIISVCSFAISLGLFSCATQQKAAAPDRPQAASEKAPAQTQEVKPAQGPAIVKSQAGVPFMSGGIGVEERNQMRQAAKAYNLGLSFAGKSRGYLTDVSVVITDDKGQPVLSAANTGPWFYFLLIPVRS
jgi:hypothetical protein